MSGDSRSMHGKERGMESDECVLKRSVGLQGWRLAGSAGSRSLQDAVTCVREDEVGRWNGSAAAQTL